jgi:DNA polymerase-3 subunit epsilon
MLNKILQLTRPLGILDLETTGLNAERDRIIQIALTMHYPHRDPISWSTLINPEVPILNTTAHRITDEKVAGMPTFKDVAPALAPKMVNIDLGGHNVEFDIGFMRWEFARAGIKWEWRGHVVDTLKICRLKIPHTLGNAYKRFVNPAGIPIGVNGLSEAHDAANDVSFCEQVLFAQLNEFQDLPRTIPELAEFCANRNPDAIDKSGKFIWVNGQACINFGKHRGIPLKNVDRNYLIWMINQANFPDDAVLIAGDALKGKYPERGNGSN